MAEYYFTVHKQHIVFTLSLAYIYTLVNSTCQLSSDAVSDADGSEVFSSTY